MNTAPHLNRRQHTPDEGIISHELKQLWLLRILFQMDLYKQFVQEDHFQFDQVADELGILHYAHTQVSFDRMSIINELRERLEMLESTVGTQDPETLLWRNIKYLGQMIELTDIERWALYFLVVYKLESTFETIIESLGKINSLVIAKIFHAAIGFNLKTIRNIIAGESTLFRTGILTLDNGGPRFNHKVRILGGVKDELLREQDNPLAFFRHNIVPSQAAKLKPSNYPHLKQDIQALIGYLGKSKQPKFTGMNVLLYGPPGTGKTEFTRMIAETSGHALFEVAVESENGEKIQGVDRFGSYRMTQSILQKCNDVFVLFDEIEDVFNATHNKEDEAGNKSGSKAWINRMLETNPIPTFWLTNNIQQLDPAVVRRFDYVLEMRVPPRSVRMQMMDSFLADLSISEQWKNKMAEHENLSPAVLERAAKVVRQITRDNQTTEAETLISHVIGNTLEALDLPRAPKSKSPHNHYRLEVLNTTGNIEEICSNLLSVQQGRICLFGPPGTGKTAFGRYLAEKLDRSLLVKRASDILAPFLGMTERRMAGMFRQASDENAVLMLDEADSFLQDRKGAQHSWQISEVNEMLTQMESFDGIFIASTNLMNSLDPAALRRFDLKLRFDYLDTKQAWLMFEDTARQLGLEMEESCRKNLAALSVLTPGDFAVIMRQARLQHITSCEELVSRLADECAIKPGQKRYPTGFI